MAKQSKLAREAKRIEKVVQKLMKPLNLPTRVEAKVEYPEKTRGVPGTPPVMTEQQERMYELDRQKAAQRRDPAQRRWR